MRKIWTEISESPYCFLCNNPKYQFPVKYRLQLLPCPAQAGGRECTVWSAVRELELQSISALQLDGGTWLLD